MVASACAGPSRTATDYERKAANTVEAVDSALQTVLVTIEAITRDGVFSPYAGRVVGRAENDAAAAQTSFAVVQPPGVASDRIRDALGPLVTDAVDVLARARIAARRGDLDAVVALRAELIAAAEALHEFEAELR